MAFEKVVDNQESAVRETVPVREKKIEEQPGPENGPEEDSSEKCSELPVQSRYRMQCNYCGYSHVHRMVYSSCDEQEEEDLDHFIPCVIIAYFNDDPLEAIEFLRRLDLARTPEDVARFLRYTPNLGKSQIGLVLGHSSDFCKQVVKVYARTFNFMETKFDVALRVYLSMFVWRGEAQQIDRILQAFAEAYYRDNANKNIASADGFHVASFSAIMLSTDAHHPSLANRATMTKADFIHNHRGVDCGRNLPSEFLSELYDSIISKPLTPLQRKGDAIYGEVELSVRDGPLGLDLETGLDGESVIVKAVRRRSILEREDYSRRQLEGNVIVAINNDSLVGVGFAETVWLLRNTRRPMLLRFRDQDVHYRRESSFL